MTLTPWHLPIPRDVKPEVRTYRLPGRDYPRVAVALQNWTGRGLKWLHLTKSVAYNTRDGAPQWARRLAVELAGCIDGQLTAAELAVIAERRKRGRGIKKFTP